MSQPAFDFDQSELDDAASPTFGVAELAEAINDQLRRGFSDGVWVRGEIDGLSTRGPHTYFSLVERTDGDKAVLNVQFFAPAKRKLTPLLKRNRLELRNGMKVRIFGRLDFWAPGGRLGLKMTDLDPRYTLGEIAQSREEVMRRLVAEGLLDTNASCRLSPVPLRVGVVASIDSAAWHDFHDELRRSQFGFCVLAADTRVQGEFAIPMVAAAIGTLSQRRDLDAIVVIRGGGARNELAVFDAEVIARAIAASPIPMLTGLGHEIDRTVADEVAHTALKTPTACAGELIDRVAAYTSSVHDRWAGITRRAEATTSHALADLAERAHRIARRTHAAVERSDERLASRALRLSTRTPILLQNATTALDQHQRRVVSTARSTLQRQSDRLTMFTARVATVDPAVQLERGWSVTRDHNGQLVRSISQINNGSTLTTELADGFVTSTVSETEPSPRGKP